MATDYKIVVVPDTGGTRPCIECPQCLGLQLLYVYNIHVHVHSVHEYCSYCVELKAGCICDDPLPE